MIGSRSMITEGARVGAGRGARGGDRPQPEHPGVSTRRRARSSAGASSRPGAWRSPPAGAAVPGWRVLPALRARHQAADRGRAPRQGPAQRRSSASTAWARDDRPLAATAELVDDRVGQSRNEDGHRRPRAAALRGCDWLAVDRLGDNVVARTDSAAPRRVVVAGHLDTVPPADNDRAVAVEGDTLWGLGSCDMKGGLADHARPATRSLEAPASTSPGASTPARRSTAPRGASSRSSPRQPDWLAGDAAILCEPTDSVVEAGCQGTVRASIVHIGGESGPTRRGPGPAATPSTGWVRCSTGSPAGAAGRWSSTAASTSSSCRPSA